MNKSLLYMLILLNCLTLFGQKSKWFEYGISLDYKEEKNFITLDSIHSKPGQLVINVKYINNDAVWTNISISAKNNYSSNFRTDFDGKLELTLEPGYYGISINEINTKEFKKQIWLGEKGLIVNLILAYIPDPLSNYYIIRSKIRLSKAS
jgi:hypothetical protein